MKNIKKLARTDGANAFIAEPGTHNGPPRDDLAEYLGETFVSSATGAEDADDVLQNDVDVEELGGSSVEIDDSASFDSDQKPHADQAPDTAPGVAKRTRKRPSGIAASPSASKTARVNR